jgi:tRNA A37 methylthiotransferase MiaB
MGKHVDQASRYYDKLYEKRKGYVRTEDFWEIPQWIGNVNHFVPNADVYIVRDMKEAKEVVSGAGYNNIVFSAMDVNAKLINELAEGMDNVHVGGYNKTTTGQWHEDLPSLAKSLGVPFKEGSDYTHFKGTQIIPRLTMSQGCKYKCAFCTVPKTIEVSPKESIDQQVESFKDMDAKLIYLNDKTFSQADNYQYLSELNTRLKEQSPEFEGFIIQTTASDLMKMTPEFLKESGIKYVELGVESYNDFILRGLYKPHNERVIDLATAKLRDLKINLVPNIIIGIPEETGETYSRTLDYLKRNSDIISHANIYNLAIYKGTGRAGGSQDRRRR